jgi:hypothetical protein
MLGYISRVLGDGKRPGPSASLVFGIRVRDGGQWVLSTALGLWIVGMASGEIPQSIYKMRVEGREAKKP